MRKPEFENLLQVLKCKVPERPTLFEFFLNGKLEQILAGRPYREHPRHEPGTVKTASQLNMETAANEYNTLVRLDAFINAGYDYVTLGACVGFGFPAKGRAHGNTVSLNDGFVITDRASFEAYEWKDPADGDNSHFDFMLKHLPPGMKVMVSGPGGTLENVIGLVGYDNLCYMMYEDPALAEAVFREVGSRLVKYYELSAPHPAIGVVMSNDDWGFNTQTFLSPEQMHKYVYPYHKKIAQVAHDCGKPVILHSCGNFDEAMEPTITELKYDGKHSYEDVILPVEKAYDRWGGRIAILGGIDLDFVVRSTPEEVYDRSKKMLAKAKDKGGYALGTGNSVPEYVPVDNYMAMIRAVIEP
ncbi:MAG: hypothetical protein FWF84_04070 [Kiritimatiellaeota bacterium]|nr:hypothetical protein [Kiritimatiellota bacterium]